MYAIDEAGPDEQGDEVVEQEEESDEERDNEDDPGQSWSALTLDVL